MSNAEVIIGTSIFSNPGLCGWAASICIDGSSRFITGCDLNTTNNRCLLTAAVSAIRELPLNCVATIVSFESYLVVGASVWLRRWKANGWKKSNGKELLNADLWLELDRLLSERCVRWEQRPRTNEWRFEPGYIALCATVSLDLALSRSRQ